MALHCLTVGDFKRRAAALVAVTSAACAPAAHLPAAPCVEAAPVAAPPLSGVVHMANSGSLQLWALARDGAPLHQYVDGLPANFELGYDSSAPTRLTVLEPLRFDAVTLFPAYYLQKQTQQASPKVSIARGVALHRVQRVLEPNCQAYVGFGEAMAAREWASDGTESLGYLLPDVEVGPIEVPCDALGGMPQLEAFHLEGLADAENDDDSPEQRLMLSPLREEDGAMHYEATEFQIYPTPNGVVGISVKATTAGMGYLANRSTALLVAEQKGWQKVRLQFDDELLVEGWVDAAVFEPDDGGSWPDEHGGYHGGGNRTGKAPTYCSGRLAAGTRIVTSEGIQWATVTRELEGVFNPGKERHQLVNFMGPHRDSFCRRSWHARDTQGYQACVENAEVRAEDVKLVCPAPRVR